jgi:hypothetical protein
MAEPDLPEVPPQQLPDWRSGLPEGLRKEPVVQQAKSLESVVKQLVDSQRQLGKSLRIPQEGAPPGEWERVWGLLGRPEAPDGYEWQAPPDLPGELGYDEQALAPWREQFHRLGLSQQQASGLLSWLAQQQHEEYRQLQEDQHQGREAVEAGLKAEYGRDVARVKALTERLLGEENLRYLQRVGLDAHPGIMRMIHQAATLVAEDRLVREAYHTGGGSGIGQWEAIKANVQHPYWDGKHPQHDAAVQEVQQLFEQMYGTERAEGGAA